jgi:hypothetical protein
MSLATGSVDDLEQLISRLPEGLIAFDGYPGVGKSTIAKAISAHLRIECIHLDDFLTPGLGMFVPAINLSELSAKLQKRPIIVEGICILAVMKQLSVMPDLLVYVQPYQEEILVGESLAEEIGAYVKKFSPANSPGVVIYYPPLVTDKEPVVTNEEFVMSPEETKILDDGRTHIDIAFIQAKTKISLALVFGGMLTLLIGLVILVYGVAGQDQALMKFPSFEVSARGIGGVIMITSCIWAFIAYQARPIYSQRREYSEKFNSAGQVLERRHYISTTQMIVEGRNVPPIGAVTGEHIDHRGRLPRKVAQKS